MTKKIILQKSTLAIYRKYGLEHCKRCHRKFKVGDTVISSGGKSRKLYCMKCYNEMYYDIPDSILDSEDWLLIEGSIPTILTL